MTNETDDKDCQKRLLELEEENRHLRAAAAHFGELAERLNHELAQERRTGSDRRRIDRTSDDRRSLTNTD
jgi:hypothetical protein